MKKKEKENVELTTEELIESFARKKGSISKVKILIGLAVVLTAGALIFAANSMNKLQTITLENEEEFTLASSPMAATTSKKNVITIPSGVVKANPFLPYRKLGNEIKTDNLVNDVPQYDLIAPPDFSESNSDAARIMETVVSGILFDKYSPSAILKIDGEDYLVKKGDTVHSYKVINIAQNSVTVQHGKNTYQAGIGELLTSDTVKYNDISNLSKKFGGVQR